MRYSNGRTGLGNRGSQEDEGRTLPLSNDVIADGITDMSCDILDQIVQEIKDSPICIINKWTNQQMFST